jgi:uncharacterized membrane protein
MSDLHDDAPAHVSKDDDHRRESAPDGTGSVFGHTETINKPRDEIYAFWRDFANLPQVMESVEEVRVLDERHSHWKMKGPNGSYEFDSVIIEDEPGRVIAWESVPGGDVRNSGRVEFLDAPPGRGTWVRAVLSYSPPMGVIGKVVAKVTGKEPEIQGRRDLRRLKQLLETGEIATSSPPNPNPAS